MSDAPRIAVIILAAGGSTRLGGQPKQLLPFRSQPLVVRAAEAALASPLWPVVVVLGAHAPAIRPHLATLPIQIVDNANWSEGMASSIHTGLACAERFSNSLDGVLLALCDQPHFSSTSIQRLLASWPAANTPGLARSSTLVAARYADTLGVPAIFGRAYFPALKSLHGSEGARRILAEHSSHVAAIDLPELATDIDTSADFQSLLDSEPPA